MRKITLGIFAHVDAGKTTFSEQLLYKTKAIRSLGRVDHKSAFLDTHSIEKDRGITIFSEQAYFTHEDCQYYLIDTPGHVDFSAEMARTIEIIDVAIIIISALDGVQSHTETIYDLLEAANVPVFFFVNKMDAANADYLHCLESIGRMAPKAIDFSGILQLAVPSDGTNRDRLLDSGAFEAMAAHDEGLMELYFEHMGQGKDGDAIAFSKVVGPLRDAIALRNIMPIFKGSALKDEGIDDFLEGLRHLAFGQCRRNGLVYKVRYDQKHNKQVFIKLFSGTLKVRDYIGDEKISEIRLHMGPKYTTVDSVVAGDVFSVIGCKGLRVGDFVGEIPGEDEEGQLPKPSALSSLQPNLQSRMQFDASVNVKDLFEKMKILEDEDPFLNVTSDIKTREITLGIMGTIQLEVLKTIIKDRFGFDVDFDLPRVVYKETITGKGVYGCGHFEPLKHYAEVHFTLEPLGPGSGIQYENACPAEHLPLNYLSQIKHGVEDFTHRGILTGSALTDVKITLRTGRGHLTHTSPGDFREATVRAIRHGLEQATSVVLEPLYDTAITVSNDLVGKVMTDLVAMAGTDLLTQSKEGGEFALITAKVPVATLKDYGNTLASLSSGRGRLRIKHGGYAPCHNTQTVIEEIAYKKEADVDHPSSSVFCQKGKGYVVPWQEAREAMHCEIIEDSTVSISYANRKEEVILNGH